jgi:hypothetical protein
VVLGPRFLIEAAFIIAVAVIAGIADLATWAIIGVVAAAWILVALVELGMWARHMPRTKRAPAPAPSATAETRREPVVIRREVVPAPAPQPEPEPEVAYIPHQEEPREWNLWDLERQARDHPGDAARNEEWTALFVYLRPFANSDGLLPTEFDSLVRESFAELILAA